MNIFAEYMAGPIIAGSIIFIIIIIIVVGICKNHKDFINNAKQIHNGMSKNEVFQIMGLPTSQETEEDKQIFIWEKSQWKGIQNGGTVVRSLKVVFKHGKVISVSNKNLDKSTFW